LLQEEDVFGMGFLGGEDLLTMMQEAEAESKDSGPKIKDMANLVSEFLQGDINLKQDGIEIDDAMPEDILDFPIGDDLNIDALAVNCTPPIDAPLSPLADLNQDLVRQPDLLNSESGKLK